MAGDTVVIPEKLDRYEGWSWQKTFRRYSLKWHYQLRHLLPLVFC